MIQAIPVDMTILLSPTQSYTRLSGRYGNPVDIVCRKCQVRVPAGQAFRWLAAPGRSERRIGVWVCPACTRLAVANSLLGLAEVKKDGFALYLACGLKHQMSNEEAAERFDLALEAVDAFLEQERPDDAPDVTKVEDIEWLNE